MLCFSLYLRAYFQVQALLGGGLYLEGRFNGGLFVLRVWGAYIWRGLYMQGLIYGILRYITFDALNYSWIVFLVAAGGITYVRD